jgi:hypothetical protein
VIAVDVEAERREAAGGVFRANGVGVKREGADVVSKLKRPLFVASEMSGFG